MAAFDPMLSGAPQSLPSFHQTLREETRVDHEMVDKRFGQFDLGDATDYGRFLTAHAMVLPAIEAALRPGELIDSWQGRTNALLSDLAALSLAAPVTLSVVIPEGIAARWGAIYVLEGSRLGGIYLTRRIGGDLPSDYLSAGHVQGQWKLILTAIDTAVGDAVWRQDAIASAKAVFATYAKAADEALSGAPRNG